jgi:hypothetical protein
MIVSSNAARIARAGLRERQAQGSGRATVATRRYMVGVFSARTGGSKRLRLEWNSGVLRSNPFAPFR